MRSDPLSHEMLEAIRARAASSQDPDICVLLRERDRLDAVYGEALSRRDHWHWEATRKISLRQELAGLLGTEDIEEAVLAVRRLQSARAGGTP